MSQEAEYYLRDLSRAEVQALARRIEQQERSAAERQMQDLLRREARELEGQVDGLRQEIDCDRRLNAGFRAQTVANNNRLDEQEQALRALAESDIHLQAGLEENQRFGEELSTRQAESERRLNGKIEGLREEVHLRHQHIQQQLECNSRLGEILRLHAEAQDERMDEVDRALGVLEEHDRELRGQLREVGRLLEQLAARQEETRQLLKEEIAARQTERQRQAASVQEHLERATRLLDGLSGSRIQAVGLQAEAKALQAACESGRLGAKDAGQEQTALALLKVVQNSADRLVLLCQEREIEVGRRRESVRLAQEVIALRLARLREDHDVTYLFNKPLTVLRDRLEVLRAQAQQVEQGGEFSRLLAHWDALVEGTRALQQQVERLWQEKDEVIDRVRGRNRIVKAILESLMEVWGADVEIADLYTVADDPRSTLMLQTKRPLGRNVTVQLDLDGRMQVSFTGYVGMECVKDVTTFQEQLGRSAGLKVEQTALRDEPGKPNPPGLDGGGSPVLYRPFASKAAGKDSEAAKS